MVITIQKWREIQILPYYLAIAKVRLILKADKQSFVFFPLLCSWMWNKKSSMKKKLSGVLYFFLDLKLVFDLTILFISFTNTQRGPPDIFTVFIGK